MAEEDTDDQAETITCDDVHPPDGEGEGGDDRVDKDEGDGREDGMGLDVGAGELADHGLVFADAVAGGGPIEEVNENGGDADDGGQQGGALEARSGVDGEGGRGHRLANIMLRMPVQ